MKPRLRAHVRARARRRCEYCRLHEDDWPLFPFHIEHIIAVKHFGGDELANLAWSCHGCNLAKSSNLSGIDLTTGKVVRLFNPRRQRWERHFASLGPLIFGRTACGRATVAVLNMNEDRRVELRRLLIAANLYPPT
jgi:hypothetical protein